MKYFLLLILFISYQPLITSLYQNKPPVPKGYAVLIGTSYVDNKYYMKNHHTTYSNRATKGVVKDLESMEELLENMGYEIKVVGSKKPATQKDFLDAISEVGNKIGSNDIFVLYYSGHGDSIPDLNGDEPKPSKYDEVFVTYDKYTLDDSIDSLLERFFTKTRNVMIVDACHSSSSYKTFITQLLKKHNKENMSLNIGASEKYWLKNRFDLNNCKFQQKNDLREPYSLIYYGAAPDDKTAYGDQIGGLLTLNLYNIYTSATTSFYWENYNYTTLACELGSIIDSEQILQYHEIGTIPASFKNSVPFKIK